jgi:hypothetical protein
MFRLDVNYLASNYNSFSWMGGFDSCAACNPCYAVSKPIPSTAMFRRRAQIGDLLEERVVDVGISGDEAMPHPTDECGFLDSEPRRRPLALSTCQDLSVRRDGSGARFAERHRRRAAQ